MPSYIPPRTTTGITQTGQTPVKTQARTVVAVEGPNAITGYYQIRYSDGTVRETKKGEEILEARKLIGATQTADGTVIRDQTAGTYQPAGSGAPPVMPGGREREAQYQRFIREALAGGQVDAAQGELLKQLLAQANGTGPSIAEKQARDAADAAIAAQQSTAASVRGPYRGLASRQAGQASSAILGSLPGVAAQARLQEQMAGQAGASALLGQMSQSRDARLLGLLGLSADQARTQYQGGLTLAQLAAQERLARLQHELGQPSTMDYVLGSGGKLLSLIGLGV